MQAKHVHIDKILPYGELIRGFANQPFISKGDLKKSLRDRGIFFPSSEKENMVPCLSTLLLSPSEFDNLRECQNTREDNFKKSSSRIEWSSDKLLIEAISLFDIQQLIPSEERNYELSKNPQLKVIENNQNKVCIEYEIERNDMNKSWYESKNTFKGSITIEKVGDNEIQIIKSYTSSESEEIGNKLQLKIIDYCKREGYINSEKKLQKILFGDFSNEHRIVFFYRLSSKMENINFEFLDIINMEFRPDDSIELPEEIKWMHKKSELILKGNQLHDTFFIKDMEYHKYLQFWEMESAFKFSYLNTSGNCNVIFSFRDFVKKGNMAEFEINISNFNMEDGSADYRNKIKNKLLDLFENRKNEIYHKFLEHIKSPSA